MVCAATLLWINQTSLKFRGRDYLSFTLNFASFVNSPLKRLSIQTLRQPIEFNSGKKILIARSLLCS